MQLRCASQVRPTATAQSAWTPVWAAPEVFRQERVTVQADIWSYGLIVWELVALQNIADYPPLGLAVQVRVCCCSCLAGRRS